MSIIYDALKKVQNNINPGAEFNNGHPKLKRKLYLIASLTIVAGIAIISIVSILLGNSKKISKANVLQAQVAKGLNAIPSKTIFKETPKQENEQISPAPKKEPSETFTLNGVFFSQDEGYALINNRIVKEGDSVGGATVKSITLDRVELEREGQSITLSEK